MRMSRKTISAIGIICVVPTLAATRYSATDSLSLGASRQGSPAVGQAIYAQVQTNCSDTSLFASKFLIVVDQTSRSNSKSANRVFSFTKKPGRRLGDIAAAPGWLLSQFVQTSWGADSTPSGSVEALVKDLGDSATQLAKRTTARWTSHKGDVVTVLAFYNYGRTENITFAEIARESRISTDLATLAKLVGSLPKANLGGPGAPKPPPYGCIATTYTLRAGPRHAGA